MSNKPCVPSISVLFVNSSPFTIIRVVSLVIVDAFNRCVSRPLTHIFKKVLKTVEPTITNDNPSTTISRIITTVFIGTPVSHATPRTVCSGFVHTVCSHLFGRNLSLQASARFNSVVSEFSTSNFFHVATGALTEPIRLLAPVFNSLNNGKSCKLFASEVFEINTCCRCRCATARSYTIFGSKFITHNGFRVTASALAKPCRTFATTLSKMSIALYNNKFAEPTASKINQGKLSTVRFIAKEIMRKVGQRVQRFGFDALSA